MQRLDELRKSPYLDGLGSNADDRAGSAMPDDRSSIVSSYNSVTLITLPDM